MSDKLNIAIDGPAGAGKSTIARAIANELGIRYLDTGAMYRAMAYLAQSEGVDLKNRDAVIALSETADIRVRYDTEGKQHTLISGKDVTDLLRTNALGMGASTVGLYPPVRQKLAELQRNVGKEYDVVMDGREITTFVLPDTPYKFYLTASPRVRAQRRLEELRLRGDTDHTLDEIEKDIIARDKNDMEREYMPLRIADDAIVIDTSDMDRETVLRTMVTHINAIRSKQN